MMNFQLPAYTPSVRQRQSRNRSESEMSAVIMFNSTVTNLPPILRRNNEGKNRTLPLISRASSAL